MADALNHECETLYGYRIEDLARVATLMEQCDIDPKQLNHLSRNIVALYGAIMKGVKKEVHASADRVILSLRYPGFPEVLQQIEEDAHGKSQTGGPV